MITAFNIMNRKTTYEYVRPSLSPDTLHTHEGRTDMILGIRNT